MRINIGSRTLVAKTCGKCGHFKQSRDFNSHIDKNTKRLVHSGYCKKCHVAAAAESNRRIRERTRQEAVRAGQPWGAEDLNEMYALINKGYSHAQIALMMGRSILGVEHALERYPRRT